MVKGKKSKKSGLEGIVEVPDGIEVTITNGEVKIKGPKGEITKNFFNPKIKMGVEDKKIVIKGSRNTKKDKKMIGTFKAHIKNMIKGCTESYKYTLKVCSGHFPMNVSVNKDELIVKNFFGEKLPRKLKIKDGVDLKVEGDMVNVVGVDKALCGQVAADIEKLTRRTAYDRRIFQDGIYIIKKDEKEIK